MSFNQNNQFVDTTKSPQNEQVNNTQDLNNPNQQQWGNLDIFGNGNNLGFDLNSLDFSLPNIGNQTSSGVGASLPILSDDLFFSGDVAPPSSQFDPAVAMAGLSLDGAFTSGDPFAVQPVDTSFEQRPVAPIISEHQYRTRNALPNLYFKVDFRSNILSKFELITQFKNRLSNLANINMSLIDHYYNVFMSKNENSKYFFSVIDATHKPKKTENVDGEDGKADSESQEDETETDLLKDLDASTNDVLPYIAPLDDIVTGDAYDLNKPGMNNMNILNLMSLDNVKSQLDKSEKDLSSQTREQKVIFKTAISSLTSGRHIVDVTGLNNVTYDSAYVEPKLYMFESYTSPTFIESALKCLDDLQNVFSSESSIQAELADVVMKLNNPHLPVPSEDDDNVDISPEKIQELEAVLTRVQGQKQEYLQTLEEALDIAWPATAAVAYDYALSQPPLVNNTAVSESDRDMLRQYRLNIGLGITPNTEVTDPAIIHLLDSNIHFPLFAHFNENLILKNIKFPKARLAISRAFSALSGPVKYRLLGIVMPKLHDFTRINFFDSNNTAITDLNECAYVDEEDNLNYHESDKMFIQSLTSTIEQCPPDVFIRTCKQFMLNMNVLGDVFHLTVHNAQQGIPSPLSPLDSAAAVLARILRCPLYLEVIITILKRSQLLKRDVDQYQAAFNQVYQPYQAAKTEYEGACDYLRKCSEIVRSIKQRKYASIPDAPTSHLKHLYKHTLIKPPTHPMNEAQYDGLSTTEKQALSDELYTESLQTLTTFKKDYMMPLKEIYTNMEPRVVPIHTRLTEAQALFHQWQTVFFQPFTGFFRNIDPQPPINGANNGTASTPSPLFSLDVKLRTEGFQQPLKNEQNTQSQSNVKTFANAAQPPSDLGASILEKETNACQNLFTAPSTPLSKWIECLFSGLKRTKPSKVWLNYATSDEVNTKNSQLLNYVFGSSDATPFKMCEEALLVVDDLTQRIKFITRKNTLRSIKQIDAPNGDRIDPAVMERLLYSDIDLNPPRLSPPKSYEDWFEESTAASKEWSSFDFEGHKFINVDMLKQHRGLRFVTATREPELPFATVERIWTFFYYFISHLVPPSYANVPLLAVDGTVAPRQAKSPRPFSYITSDNAWLLTQLRLPLAAEFNVHLQNYIFFHLAGKNITFPTLIETLVTSVFDSNAISRSVNAALAIAQDLKKQNLHVPQRNTVGSPKFKHQHPRPHQHPHQHHDKTKNNQYNNQQNYTEESYPSLSSISSPQKQPKQNHHVANNNPNTPHKQPKKNANKDVPRDLSVKKNNNNGNGNGNVKKPINGNKDQNTVVTPVEKE